MRPISLQGASPLRFVDPNFLGKFPQDLRIPPLKFKIVLESSPLKSRILVGRLGVTICDEAIKCNETIGYGDIHYTTPERIPVYITIRSRYRTMVLLRAILGSRQFRTSGLRGLGDFSQDGLGKPFSLVSLCPSPHHIMLDKWDQARTYCTNQDLNTLLVTESRY